MVDELDRTHGRRTKQSHFFYKGHSWSSVIGQTLAFDSARKRLWNTCYQLYLHRGKGQHNDKLITHFDQTTELGAPHVFTGSSLRWSVSSPFPLLISSRKSGICPGERWTGSWGQTIHPVPVPSWFPKLVTTGMSRCPAAGWVAPKDVIASSRITTMSLSVALKNCFTID